MRTQAFCRCSVRGLSDADMATLNQSLAQQTDENLGMAMIYVLVSAAQEWLREKVSSKSHAHNFTQLLTNWLLPVMAPKLCNPDTISVAADRKIPPAGYAGSRDSHS